MKNIKTNISELIGNTPMLELKNLCNQFNTKAKIVAKLEGFNPAGSAKDRVALSMINDAEERGLLKKDSVIIEPTSGNTGIGLAAVAASKGYKVILTMPENMSVERQKLLKAYGAEIVLTSAEKGMTGAIAEAKRIAKETPNSFIPDQFSNKANSLAHTNTTGPEIWNDTNGEVDIFIATVGTGGTITGTGEYLKSKNPKIEVIAVEPFESNLLSGGKAGPHKIQGIGANFVPDILNRNIYDRVIAVKSNDAFELSRLIACKEGILVGISSGAALKAAVEVALSEENTGKTIVVVLTDSGEKYISTELFN